MSAITNYLIGIIIMIFALLTLRNKYNENPGMKIFGLSMKTISVVIYVGIAITALLIIAVLAGWIRH
jgi:hypothetical protein